MEKGLEQLESELRLRGFSKNTVQTYISQVLAYLNWVKKPIGELLVDDAKNYLGELLSRGASVRTVALVRSCLAFFYLEILKMPISIKAPKIPRSVPVVLTKDEVLRLIKGAKNKKHRVLIELLYSSGLRLSEVVNLKVEELDLDEKIGWVRGGKGGKDRMFILSLKVCLDLGKFIAKKGIDSGYIFRGKFGGKLSGSAIKKVVKGAAKNAGIKKNVHVHTLRHSFATHLLENGVDIRKIQELLGHSNLATTQIYTKVSTTELKKVKSPLDSLF